MVKVIEKSLEEIAEEKRNEDLLNITKEMFEGKGFVRGSSNNRVCIIFNKGNFFKKNAYSQMIFTHFSNNFMEVYSPKYLDDALKLAEAYEEATGEEFTLKKDY